MFGSGQTLLIVGGRFLRLIRDRSAPLHVEPKISTFTLATLATGISLLGTALIAQVASSSNSTGITRTAAFFAGGGAGVTVVGGLMLYFDSAPAKAPLSPAVSPGTTPG